MEENLECINKQQLCEGIKEQQGLYSKKLIEYMYSLVNLESSILKRETFSESELEVLRDIELFRQITNFNIYYKTIDIYTKCAIEARKLDKLKFECTPYRREKSIYLKDGDQIDLLVSMKRLADLDSYSNGYEIDYYRKPNEKGLFERFGLCFEESNDLDNFEIEEDNRKIKTYPHIRSRVLRFDKIERND